MSASLYAGVSRLRGSCQAVLCSVFFVTVLVLAGGSLAVASAAGTDVYVNDLLLQQSRDVVNQKGDSNTIVEIKASPTNTGAFEPGSVWIEPTSGYNNEERTGNKIIMSGGKMGYLTNNSHHIMAANEGSVLRGNEVVITGGTITNGSSIIMAGGYTSTGTAIGNLVSVTGDGVLDATVDSRDFVIHGGRGKVLAKDNKVILSPGAGGKVAGSHITVYGGSAYSGNAEANTVELGGAASVGSVYGGYASGGNAEKNTVTLGDAASVGTVYGGLASDGRAAGNVVSVGGTANVSTLYGGYVEGASASLATENVVNVRDSAKVGTLYGGYSKTNSTTNNTVNLYSGQALGPGSMLWGGYSEANLDARTGNILAVYATGVTAANVKNFQHYRFHLPATITPGATMLTLTDPAGVDIRTPEGQAATTVGVGIMGGGNPLKYNDSVVLLKAEGGLQADANMKNTIEGMQGISKVYTFALEQQSDALLARVTNGQPPVEPGVPPVVERKSPDAVRKSPSEAKAAAVTVLTQGGDLAAGQGMSNAREAAAASAREEVESSSTSSRPEGMTAAPLGLATFGAFSGGTARHKSGSYVDVNSFSFMAGLAKRLSKNGAEFLAGAFVEAGFGSYDSFNGQPNGPDIKGWGNSRYMGGGLLGRVDLTDGAAQGLYGESSFRVGSMHSSYKSDDLNPALGRADYNTSAVYVGLHGGLGYVWALSEKGSLDMYGKYFWTRTGSSDVHILGDAVHFEAVNSHRVRAGARYAYAVNANFSPYIGAAWEHEFAGDARSIVAGEAAPAPSLKGSSGLGEIGLTWKPSQESVMAIDLGMQGHVGMRRGVSGNAQLRVVF